MQILGGALFLGYIIWRVVNRFRPKEKTYQDYIRKAVHYETYFGFGKALKSYQEAQQLSELTSVQQASLNLSCGNCLLKLKEYKQAVVYYDRAFEGAEGRESIHHTGQLKRALKGYLLANEYEKARQLYERFVDRTDDTSRFNKLKRIKQKMDAKR